MTSTPTILIWAVPLASHRLSEMGGLLCRACLRPVVQTYVVKVVLLMLRPRRMNLCDGLDPCDVLELMYRCYFYALLN